MFITIDKITINLNEISKIKFRENYWIVFQFLNQSEIVLFSSSLYTIEQRKEKFNKLLKKLWLLEDYFIFKIDDWEDYLILDKELKNVRYIDNTELWNTIFYIWKNIYIVKNEFIIDNKYINKYIKIKEIIYQKDFLKEEWEK